MNTLTGNHIDLLTLSSRQWLLVCSAILALLGLLLVASASMDMAAIYYESPFFYVKRHAVYLAAGLVIAGLVYQMPLAMWNRSGALLLMFAFFLLVLVLIPGIGKTVNGSARWIGVGPINIQVSEIVKICVMVYVSGYLVRRVDEVRAQFWGFIKPVLILTVMMLLLLRQPDFGSVVVIMSCVFLMLFLAGVKLSQFLFIVLGAFSLGAIIVLSSTYRMKRILGYIDPWADQYSSGYQLVQSLIAFGRGEWFGVGLGNSVQKLFYLPEAHTDFVFAILAEEFGFFGNVLVIVLFTALVFVGMNVGRKAEQLGKLFNAYLVYGFSVMIGLQAMINMGVSSGLLPTKGLTLPFISYGGSSLIVMCVVVALIMRADLENELDSPAIRKKRKNNRVRSSLKKEQAV